jgi:hypothetical protein
MEIFDKEFEKPFNLRGHAVRAILEGRKTQMRMVINPRLSGLPCPFGKPGYKLWVRERWAITPGGKFKYMADSNQEYVKWRPSSTMPRPASRLTLEIARIGIERVQQITEADCLAEGITDDGNDLRAKFEVEWATTNFTKGYIWRENPLVYVIEYRVYEAKSEALKGYECALAKAS